MIEIILNKKGGPLGIVRDYVVKTEYQKKGGIHWHILFWVEPGSAPSNVLMAEIPRCSDTSNVEAKEWCRSIKYIVNDIPRDVLKDIVERYFKSVSMTFLLKVPNLWMKLMRIVYTSFTDVGVRRIVWLCHTI